MKHPNLHLVLGPPGTGKTTTLLNLMEEELANDVRPDRVGFLAFTRKAAGEARERAMQRFGFSSAELPWFRTIHSMAFAQLGLSRSQVLGKRDLTALGKQTGLDFGSCRPGDEMALAMMEAGDKLLFIENLSRVTGKSLQQTWGELDHAVGVNPLNGRALTWESTEQFARSYNRFKEKTGKFDYTDMLEQFVKDKLSPKLDVLFVDEAQDLSALQWQAVSNVAKNCRIVYVGGDDDQSIYRWAGADVDQFLSLTGRVTVLNKSYRLSKSVHKIAAGVVKQITQRHEKVFTPRDEEGSVEWHNDPEEVDLSQGSWLLLARHVYQLYKLERICREEGYAYEINGKSIASTSLIRAIMAWEAMRRGSSAKIQDAIEAVKMVRHARPAMRELEARVDSKIKNQATDAAELATLGVQVDKIWHEGMDGIRGKQKDYILRARRKGEKLLTEPRIKISTIHGSKGGEADNVMLLTDISETTYETMQQNSDDEHRVFYVGITRARNNLHIILPSGVLSYTL